VHAPARIPGPINNVSASTVDAKGSGSSVPISAPSRCGSNECDTDAMSSRGDVAGAGRGQVNGNALRHGGAHSGGSRSWMVRCARLERNSQDGGQLVVVVAQGMKWLCDPPAINPGDAAPFPMPASSAHFDWAE
jgi:hypothetical protein